MRGLPAGSPPFEAKNKKMIYLKRILLLGTSRAIIIPAAICRDLKLNPGDLVLIKVLSETNFLIQKAEIKTDPLLVDEGSKKEIKQ